MKAGSRNGRSSRIAEVRLFMRLLDLGFSAQEIQAKTGWRPPSFAEAHRVVWCKT